MPEGQRGPLSTRWAAKPLGGVLLQNRSIRTPPSLRDTSPFRGGIKPKQVMLCPKVLYQGKFRWKRSTGTFPKYQYGKRDTGRSGLVRSALEKLSLFSPTCSVCPEAWARGVSPSADGDSGGYSPPKNLSPAALSWISLTDSTIPFLFVPARCFSQFALVFLRILCTSNCFTSAFCFSICTFLQTTT